MTGPTATLITEERQVEAGISGRRPKANSRPLLALIHIYQLTRSGRPTGCRYLPTCSEYAVEAITEHGTARGSLMAVRRLARCTPWGGHGIDPVPTGRTSCTPH